MANHNEERRDRPGMGAAMGGSTGGTLGGGKRAEMGQGAGDGPEADVPKLSAAEIDDTTPDPVRDAAVARATPDQLRANPRPDDGAPGAG